MFRVSYIVGATLTTLALAATSAVAQSPIHATSHIIVVTLVEHGGSVPYAFDPANVQVQRGDTLRFLQSADTPHNVRFTKEPGGAKLGGATTGPYLVAKGQKYDLVIDSRFVDGNYTFVCDPHEAIGMHGSVTVVSTATAAGGK
ncbi:MAG TPA: plastocyanin/azurin family copper-binding protein [Gemmatimonadaceae bacterium]|jgi:plastocyanin